MDTNIKLKKTLMDFDKINVNIEVYQVFFKDQLIGYIRKIGMWDYWLTDENFCNSRSAYKRFWAIDNLLSDYQFKLKQAI